MGAIIHIATEAITTNITTVGTTICTGVGLAPFMVALGIIAIGKQYFTVAPLTTL